MIVIGVTGSFSSGKSAVTAVFRKLGAKVFDADATAKEVTRKGTAVYRAIVQIFGKEFVLPGGELDRKRLAKRVFDSPKDLRTLNVLIHPEVIFEALKMKKALKNKKGVLVMDVPLLYESRMEKLVDRIVVVVAAEKQILKRGKQKGVDPSLSKKILKNQWSFERKARRADYIIENKGNLKDLEKKAREVYKTIREGI